jgi:hypothetical protein
MFSLAAFFVGSRDHRTQFWKGAIQGSFHKSLVEIGSVVSEEKILQQHFDEIVIGWFSSKNVSGESALRSRWPPQPNLA